MSYRYAFKTRCGDLKVFKTCVTLEGKLYYFNDPISDTIASEIRKIIDDAFFIGKNTNAREVAETLRVSLRTVSRYISCCGMPHRKIGGTVRIPEDKLIKWLAKEGRC